MPRRPSTLPDTAGLADHPTVRFVFIADPNCHELRARELGSLGIAIVAEHVVSSAFDIALGLGVVPLMRPKGATATAG
jgi:hypothetical protein